jgi:hypothetical protein
MKNEFGEEIPDKELNEIVFKVRTLSESQLDSLWLSCGFVYEKRESQFKAINKFLVNEIKRSSSSARKMVLNLLLETPVKEFNQHLNSL